MYLDMPYLCLDGKILFSHGELELHPLIVSPTKFPLQGSKHLHGLKVHLGSREFTEKESFKPLKSSKLERKGEGGERRAHNEVLHLDVLLLVLVGFLKDGNDRVAQRLPYSLLLSFVQLPDHP